MNVWILCNEDAGRGLSADDLRKLVEQAGHTVAGVAKRYDEGSPLPDGNPDLVVAAGGDGTVATVAGIACKNVRDAGDSSARHRQQHRDQPRPECAGARAHRVLVDRAARALRSRMRARCVERMAGRRRRRRRTRARRYRESASRERTPARTFRPPPRSPRPSAHFATRSSISSHAPGRSCSTAKTMSDAFLLVEVLNIRSIGPNLVFAPDASPSDGYFDVILAQECHREELLTYLGHRSEGRDTRLALPRTALARLSSHVHRSAHRRRARRYVRAWRDIDLHQAGGDHSADVSGLRTNAEVRFVGIVGSGERYDGYRVIVFEFLDFFVGLIRNAPRICRSCDARFLRELGNRQPQTERKTRSFTRHAGDVNGAPIEGKQLPGDRQAQTRSAELHRGVVARLSVGIEDPIDDVRRNTDSCIGHFDVHGDRVARKLPGRDG